MAILLNNRIYKAETVGYIKQNYRIYLEKYWISLAKTMGYIGKNYGIYWAKTIGDISGYSWQKLWDILWYILVKHYDIFVKTLRYTGPLDILS